MMSWTQLDTILVVNVMSKRIAHFLLSRPLSDSPPNDALCRVYAEAGYEVDFFSIDQSPLDNEGYSHIQTVQFGARWMLKNCGSFRWSVYDAFSCTSEDPVALAGVLSTLWRKPFIFLADEIRSGSYRGERAEYWKKTCRWAMRRADLTIVNDESRISLQRGYAGLKADDNVVVYPGCFLEPPQAVERNSARAKLDIKPSQLVLAFSGYFSIHNGIDWALESLDSLPNTVMTIQPLSVNDLSAYLLSKHKAHKQLRIAPKRLSWKDSWASMGAADIGVSIYRNPGPQFQNMGISSNRLCMFLAMGVPVIVSRQPSFEFVEEFNCGVMVDSQAEFLAAVEEIAANLTKMKANALRCADEYIDTQGRFSALRESVDQVLSE